MQTHVRSMNALIEQLDDLLRDSVRKSRVGDTLLPIFMLYRIAVYPAVLSACTTATAVYCMLPEALDAQYSIGSALLDQIGLSQALMVLEAAHLLHHTFAAIAVFPLGQQTEPRLRCKMWLKNSFVGTVALASKKAVSISRRRMLCSLSLTASAQT